MDSTNYLNMMLSGYFKEPDLLKLHLIQHHKLAERDNFTSLVQFYDNCNKILNGVKDKILNLYNNRKKELYLILSDYKTKNKDTSEIQKEIDYLKPNNFGIPLYTITNQQLTGHLYYKDIEFIENTIKQIFIYVDEKKDYHCLCNDGNFLYSGAENKLYTGREFFEKIYLSKDNLKFPINFPDLIPKYYDLSLEKYLSDEKNKAKELFSKKWVTVEFISSEVKKLNELTNGLTESINSNKNQSFEHKKEQLKYCKIYSEFLKEKSKEIDKVEVDKPLQKEINKLKDNNSIHPEHNPNLWSLDCYKLFKYLFDNYYKDSRKPTKRQLTNIWFYMNEYDKIKYNLKATKDSYKLFIKNHYDIEIKNFDKAEQKYNTEYGTMNDHRINFEDSF